MRRFDKWLSIALVPVIVYLFFFLTLVFNADFYSALLVKTNVNTDRAQHLTQELFVYFKSAGFSQPKISLLTQEENAHIKDVKVLIQSAVVIFVVLIVLLTLLLSKTDKRCVILLFGGGIALFLPLLLLLFDFSTIFTGFHEVFFPQGNWVFPPTDLLVSVYTLEFFRLFAEQILIRGEIMAVLVVTFSVMVKRLNI